MMTAITHETFKSLENSLKFAAMMPRAIRVRRRGFSAKTRRGSIVKHDGKAWSVARRSNHHLWLYEHQEMVGKNISVKLPQRYEAH